jgi:acyl-coenzyme A synthetase/AMP-(fatty) acid ligase
MVSLWENLRPEIDGFKILTMPDFETFLVDEKVEKYPYTLTWEESKHDPVFIVHTSGSTGKFGQHCSNTHSHTSQAFQNQSALLHT